MSRLNYVPGVLVNTSCSFSVSLTQTRKKGLELKQKLIEEVSAITDLPAMSDSDVILCLQLLS